VAAASLCLGIWRNRCSKSDPSSGHVCPTETTICHRSQGLSTRTHRSRSSSDLPNTQLLHSPIRKQCCSDRGHRRVCTSVAMACQRLFRPPRPYGKGLCPISFGTGKPKRLYKTGDVGRRLADGSLQLLGRRDQQIKLPRLPLELAISNPWIAKTAGVRQCAVVAATNDRATSPSSATSSLTLPGSEISPRALSETRQGPSAWIYGADLLGL